MQKEQNTSLVWFTNNLRTHDNSTLTKAIANSNQVIGLYCFNPNHFKTDEFGFKKTEKFRAKFLIDTITDLKQKLSQLNIPLFIYNKKPEDIIPQLVTKNNINNIYLQEEWTFEEVETFNKVKTQLPKRVKFTTSYNQFLFHPEDIPFTINQLPKIFTEFRKTCEKFVHVRPEIITPTNQAKNLLIKNETIVPTLLDLGFEDFEQHTNTAFPFKGGETEALNRLQDYFFNTKKLGFYKKTRNGLLGKDFSSKFSPWLANGSISAKHIYYKIKQFESLYFKNESTYWLVFELIWRDYFKYVSMKFGNQIFKINGILNNKYTWINNQKEINNWINGKTPESFVNANMIELKKTGWMSNRGRQNVASYFAKSMNLDWRIGAAYFESLLLDYDVHSNYGNWMYVSGVGNDPRDRKFNVKLQAERYDSSGKYQRLWLQDTLF
ncbi:DASH family cryptochrome [Neotamlana laminarinivorans]|uniref:Cryptochrome DASH n=1 Tax=Neotamlana laminarinivorans TaxID=2883124 RepID=A0A9X1HZE0_9FLAO|nr:DASH family cryptochrome [Tamlana laminarinivorans]MCB4797452.1 DASH family cryptochrome [Tamlana laminarinivorans]